MRKGDRARAWRRGRRRLHHLVEPELARRDVGLLAARELDELADERRHRLELLLNVGDQLRALARVERARVSEQPDVRPQRRDRRAQLVRGVGDELPLGAQRRLEGGEQLVETRRERLISSRPRWPGALAQVAGLDDPLGRLGQPPKRRDSRARDERAEDRGDADATERDEDKQPAQMREVPIDVEERARDRRSSPVPIVSIRVGTPPIVCVLNRRSSDVATGAPRLGTLTCTAWRARNDDLNATRSGSTRVTPGLASSWPAATPWHAGVQRRQRSGSLLRSLSTCAISCASVGVVDGERRTDDRDSDRERREHRQAQPEAHRSLNVKPTPRTVWIKPPLAAGFELPPQMPTKTSSEFDDSDAS